MFKDGNTVKKRITASVVAVALAAVTIGTAVYLDGNQAYASRTSLRRIEDIVSEHSSTSEDGLSPFVIYEVVPDYADASLGYLIGGEEPIEDGRSIKDMPSKAERDAKVDDQTLIEAHTYDDALVGDSLAANYTADAYTEASDKEKSLAIRGQFTDDNGTHDGNYEYYKETTGSSGGYVKVEPTTVGNYFEDCADFDAAREKAKTDQIRLYRDYVTFERSDTGDTDVTELHAVDTDGITMPYELGTGSGKYTSQRFSVSNITGYSSFHGNDLIYSTGLDSFIGVFKSYGFKDSADNDVDPTVVDVDANPADYKITVTLKDDSKPADNVQYDLFLTDPAYSWNIVTADGSGEYYAYSVNNAGDTFATTEGKDVVYGYPDYDDSNCPEAKGPYYYVDENLNPDAYEYDASNGTYRFDADYTKTIYHTFKYEGGFTNNEWFKNWVFDRTEASEQEALCVDVVPVKLSELTTDMLDKANLIYFAGGDYHADAPPIPDNDIAENVALAIVNKLIEDDFPIMMEYSTFYKNADNTNLKMMCKTLMQASYPTDAVTSLAAADSATMWYGTKSAVSEDISFVHGTLFVNDDIDDTDSVNPSQRIAGPNFSVKYPDAKTDYGFQEVTAEIDSEKPFLELNNAWGSFNSEISIATSIRYILNANNSRVAVKNTLNILDIEPLNTSQYSDINSLKNDVWRGQSASTLTTDFLEEAWVKNNIIGTVSGGDEPTVTIRRMGTKELVGINTDLNSTYDMIYIGMDTTLMNTRITNGVKTDNTTYVNADGAGLNGLIYTHVGDTIDTYINYSNTRSLAGNDITLDKTRELVQYIKAGYALLITDGFFNADGSINTGKVDKSSNMYKLMDWLINDKQIVISDKEITGSSDDGGKKYFGKNVMTKKMLTDTSTATASRETFAKYINIAKLQIKLESQPEMYNVLNSNGEVDHHEFIPANGDGSHTLKYTVKLSNDSVVSESNTTYDCRLYIDLDSDGKYEEAENLGGLSINNGDSEETTTDDAYHLTAGNTYYISRDVPEDFVGFLAWKLEFRQNGAPGVRSAVIGYSAVKAADGRKPTIKILQIVPNGNIEGIGYFYRNALDLSSDDMERLYDAVEDFDIQVETVTVQNYIMKYNLSYGGNKGSYYNYLCNYDMIVLGFTDMYHFVANTRYQNGSRIRKWGYDTYKNQWTWIDDLDDGYDMSYQTAVNNGQGGNDHILRPNAYTDAAIAIRQYALSGRSILFTHDLSSYEEVNNRWGYYANTYWRDIQGMDRFGILADSDAIKNISYYSSREGTVKSKYESVYDRNEHNGKSTERSGLTEHTVMRFDRITNHSLTTRGVTRGYNGSGGNHTTNTVTAINEGQITQYPYLITSGTGGFDSKSFFTTANTHSQYYQLNLDTDSTDKNDDDDVVVWYTIGGTESAAGNNYYTALHNDARNNYYIFSKGNILYTGAGHYNDNDNYPTELEKKLFVNTLVAAYNSGVHDPEVVFKANPWEDGVKKSISSVYIPYDAQLVNGSDTPGGFLDDSVSINFQPINNNFRNSNKDLIVKYYVKGTSSDYTIKVGDTYYKEVTPTKVSIADGLGNLTGLTDYYTLKNRNIYQGEFRVADFALNKMGGAAQNVELYIRVGISKLDDETELEAVPAGECIEPINVCGTQLRELE